MISFDGCIGVEAPTAPTPPVHVHGMLVRMRRKAPLADMFYFIEGFLSLPSYDQHVLYSTANDAKFAELFDAHCRD